MKIAAHVPNLFDRSRFGGKVEFVETVEDLKNVNPDLVIVDLDRCADLKGFSSTPCKAIAFGPHVESDLHDEAVSLGYDEVLPRSIFFKKRLPALLEDC